MIIFYNLRVDVLCGEIRAGVYVGNEADGRAFEVGDICRQGCHHVSVFREGYVFQLKSF